MGASQGTRGHVDRERHRHRLQGDTGIGETQGPTARGTVSEGDVKIGVGGVREPAPRRHRDRHRGTEKSGRTQRRRGRRGLRQEEHRDQEDMGTGTGIIQGAGMSGHGDWGDTGSGAMEVAPLPPTGLPREETARGRCAY